MTGRRRSESGQSTVEFVLVAPFVALMLLTVVQVGLLVRTPGAGHPTRPVRRSG